MRFVEFKGLSMAMKARLLCEKGCHLTERREGDYIIALYAVDDFYVEVHHCEADSEVVLISSFFSTGLLEPYLAQVDISHLLQAVFHPCENRTRGCK